MRDIQKKNILIRNSNLENGVLKFKIFSKRLKIQFVFLVCVPNMRVEESETILRKSRHFSDLSNWHRIIEFARLNVKYAYPLSPALLATKIYWIDSIFEK